MLVRDEYISIPTRRSINAFSRQKTTLRQAGMLALQSSRFSHCKSIIAVKVFLIFLVKQTFLFPKLKQKFPKFAPSSEMFRQFIPISPNLVRRSKFPNIRVPRFTQNLAEQPRSFFL
jgi:hypothetical protein